MSSGSYLLLIRLSEASRITVGRLGAFDFPRGWYVYAGSAMRGLGGRMARHRRSRKKLHWHIDYLLACGAAQLVECNAYPSAEKQECLLSRSVMALEGGRAAARGFGSSDCCNGCEAHLAYFRKRPALPRVGCGERER